MRDILIILGMCLAALGVGTILLMAMPTQDMVTTPEEVAVEEETQLPTPAAPAPAASEVAFAVIESGTHAQGVSTRKNVAARDQAAFAQVWKMVHGEDKVMMPKIDFSKFYVIAVFAGQKPSGGHSVRVAKITDSATERTLRVELSEPGAGCVVTQSLTTPYTIVTVPVSMIDLKAVDSTLSVACD